MSEPFLTYLTIFQSRLGIANVILGLTGLAHQPIEALIRKTRDVYTDKERIDVAAAENNALLEYLVDKRLLTANFKTSGRYTNTKLIRTEDAWTVQSKHFGEQRELAVFCTDIWMSHPLVRSTIGTPTPDNAEESVELCHQLGLLSKAKNTWTAAGQTTALLRSVFPVRPADNANPFLFGAETIGLLRQVVAKDGFLTRELLRELARTNGVVSRDHISQRFPDIVKRSVSVMKKNRLAPHLVRIGQKFLELITTTAAKREKQSTAPGVLEHRVSPRLEWLVDLGYLSKDGLPKNGFEYRVLPATQQFLESLDGSEGLADPEGVAIDQWLNCQTWAELRQKAQVLGYRDAVIAAYNMLRRRIGPVPLSEIAFVSCLLTNEAIRYRDALLRLISFGQTTNGVTLSGGRYERTPVNILIADELLGSN